MDHSFILTPYNEFTGNCIHISWFINFLCNNFFVGMRHIHVNVLWKCEIHIILQPQFFKHEISISKDVGTFDVKYFNQLIVDDLYTEAQSQVIRWFVTLRGILFRCCLTLIRVINCEESRWTAVYQVHVNNLLGYINVRCKFDD